MEQVKRIRVVREDLFGFDAEAFAKAVNYAIVDIEVEKGKILDISFVPSKEGYTRCYIFYEISISKKDKIPPINK